MSKKIVVLTGSPRKNSNSSKMAEAFIEAAEKKYNDIVRFDTANMKLGGCRACETCFSTGKACTFDDDFNMIAREIQVADMIVFAMPVYWYSIPSQIKTVIDRLFSFCVGGKDVSGKKCALITCCEENDISVMDGVKVPYERSIALLGWTSVGEVLVPGTKNDVNFNNEAGIKKAVALADCI